MKIGDDKHFFGIAKVGTKGQIVIPKEARDKYDIRPGDNLLILGDEKGGIWIATADSFDKLAPGALAQIVKGRGFDDSYRN
ncbi:MAG: AbrB/MazE/SpoVT family DNA-binding domain-containing protein [Clostridia bacterium]|nr:AbrB/MazE/SpoVT family DNA-binding domain-containing protein [Clostridia bacterium]